MRIVRFELNDKAEEMFVKLTETTEYFGDTPRTLFVKLMMQATSKAVPVVKAEDQTEPELGKVELRHQRERMAVLAAVDDKIAVGIARARCGTLRWPKRVPGIPVDEGGMHRYCFPAEYGLGKAGGDVERAWVPPEDYPQSLLDEAEIEEVAYSRRVAGQPVDTDPPPQREDYDSEEEFRPELNAWKVRNNAFGLYS